MTPNFPETLDTLNTALLSFERLIDSTRAHLIANDTEKLQEALNQHQIAVTQLENLTKTHLSNLDSFLSSDYELEKVAFCETLKRIYEKNQRLGHIVAASNLQVDKLLAILFGEPIFHSYGKNAKTTKTLPQGGTRRA